MNMFDFIGIFQKKELDPPRGGWNKPEQERINMNKQHLMNIHTLQKFSFLVLNNLSFDLQIILGNDNIYIIKGLFFGKCYYIVRVGSYRPPPQPPVELGLR